MNVAKRIKNAKRFLNKKVKKIFSFLAKHPRAFVPAVLLLIFGLIAFTVVPIIVKQLPQEAAVVNMVQTGTVAMSTATQNVTITAVDPSKSFVLCNFRTNTSTASQVPSCHLGSGTTLTVQANAANANIVVDWKVVEFTSGVTVQRGVQSFSNGHTSRNVSISAVDLSKTFVLATTRVNTTSQSVDERRMVTAQLTSTTNLQLLRSENGSSANVAWQVITIDDANVQSGIATIASGATSQTATISAVDPTKSFLVFSSRPEAAVNGVERHYFTRGTLTNATTLTFTRRGNSGEVTIPWFVVEMTDGTTVQRGSATATGTQTTLNAAITSVDLTRSVPIISSDVIDVSLPNSTDDLDSGAWNATLSSSTNLQLQRASNQDRPSTVDWQVIQFDDAAMISDFTACRTETGTMSIPSGSASANATLTTAITDVSQAFLLVDSSGTSSVEGGDDHMVSGFIANPTTLTFQRGASPAAAAEVSYQLIECFNSEFDVQHGEIVIGVGNLSNTGAISSVNTANSVVIVSSRTDDASSQQDQALVTGELANSTTVHVERAVSGTGSASVRYQVVTFSGASGVNVQTGSTVLNSGSQTQTTSISTTDTSSTWVYCSWDSSDNGLQQAAIGCELQDATTLAFHRFAASAYTNRVRWYAIEFPPTQVTVQRGAEANDPGSADDTQYDHDISISPVVSLTKAFAFVTNTTSGTGNAFPRNKWIEFLSSLSNLRTRFWRGAATGAFDDNVKYWQVIEFSPSINAAPTGVWNSTSGSSGNIDLNFDINDANGDDVRARIEYETDSDGACNGPWAPATLVAPVTADFSDSGGLPNINNATFYQLGSGTNTRIVTDSGANTVTVFWNSSADLPSANGTQCLRLRANDNSVDQITPATQTLSVNNLVMLDQEAYRFFENSDSADVGAPIGAQDTPIVLDRFDKKFRLRMLVESTNAVSASSQNVKLQFAQRGTDSACDSGFVGETYEDVTGSSAIAFYDNSSPNDGDAVVPNANDPTASGTTVPQTYGEQNPFTNPNVIASGNNGLWDFSLQDNGSIKGSAYCFRIVNNDGSPIATYSQLPEIRTRARAYYVCQDEGRLWSLDWTSGGKTFIGPTGTLDTEAIAYWPGNDTLYGMNFGNFGSFNQTTGAFSVIADIDGGVCLDGTKGCLFLTNVDGLGFDGGTGILWGSGRFSGNDVLFHVNKTTGQVIRDAFGVNRDYLEIQGAGVFQDVQDVAIDPTTGKVYIVSTGSTSANISQLVQIDKVTGEIIVDTELDQRDVEGADFYNDGTFYVTADGTSGGMTTSINHFWEMSLAGVSSNGIDLNDQSPTCNDPESVAVLTAPINRISGTVFHDNAPQNSAFDMGEGGLAGITVRLFEDTNSNGVVDPTDRYLQTVITDSNGEYEFEIALLGEFVVEIDTNTLPFGYALTTDNIEGAVFADDVNFGETDTDNDFGANDGADCDGDGIPDFIENVPPGVDTDGDGIPDMCDLDSDNDGIPDAIEGMNDSDGDGIPDYRDLDSDNDGIPDAIEANGGVPPVGYNPATGRLHGTDADSDGLLDQVDSHPAIQYGASTTTLPVTDTDNDGVPDYRDRDSDNDSILDVVEAGGIDTDGDGIIDGFVDVNGDGYHDPLTIIPLPIPDTDGDGFHNYRDQDSDGDGIPDYREARTDADYYVPAIIEDLDGDGVIDAFDISQGGEAPTPVDSDGDGIPDYIDTDSDNDGVPDLIEGHDSDFNGVPSATPSGNDTDGDGIDDAFDTDNANTVWFNNNLDVNASVQDFDGDGIRDWRDDNDDNDGFGTIGEDFNGNLNWADDFTQGCFPRPDYYCYVEPVDIAVTKNVDIANPSVGQTVVFNVGVTNNGPITATSVEVTDLLPAGLTYVSHIASAGTYTPGTGVWNIGTMTNSQSQTLQITATVNASAAGSVVTNTATLTNVLQGDSNSSNNAESAAVTVKAADIEVIKTVDNATPNVGENVTFTVSVTNSGPDSATVTVTDSLPIGLTYVSHIASAGTYTPGTGAWNIGSMANGQNQTLQITASVNTGTGGSVITNTASVTSSSEGDPDPGDNSDSESVTVQLADLSLAKGVDDANPGEGDTIVFTLTLTNGGPNAATGVTVRDLFPAGLTFVSSAPSQGSYNSGTGDWTVGTVANAASATLQITATVNAGTGGSSIENTAQVWASDVADPDSTPGNSVPAEDDQASVTVSVRSADLSLTKIVDVANPNEGGEVVFTVTVSNAGPDTAESVVVRDALPAGVTFVSSTPSQGSYNSGTGDWTVGNIVNAANATLQITATVNAGTAGQVITNYAEVWASGTGDPDSTPGNSSTTEDDDDTASITVQSADLAIAKTVDNGAPNVGDTITYTVTVTNNGPNATTGVVVNDLLPAGLTYVSNTPSQGSYTSGTGDWAVGGLANGASATLQLTATVNVGTQGTIITNTASVTASSVGDPVPGNDSASEDVDVQSADLSFTKDVSDANPDEGDTIVYTLTVSNAGPDAATGVVVTDLMPIGVTYVSNTPSQGSYVSGTGVWTVGTVANGGNATLQISVTVDAGTAGLSILNEAEITASDVADPDSTPGNNSGTEDDEDSVTITVGNADLAVVKTVDDVNPDVGDTITFTITITNNGPDNATGVALTDALPAGLTYLSHIAGQGSYVPGTGIWTVGAIANGNSVALDISATVNAGQGGQSVNNTATITASDQGDSVPGNNSDSQGLNVPQVDLSLTKVVDDATPREGDSVVYTVTVANAGPDTAFGVEVTDLLPSGVTYVSDAPSQGSYVAGTGVWTVGAISNGGNATIQLTASVDAGTAGSTIVNEAEVTASASEDVDSTPGNSSGTEDDEDDVSITVESADLEVIKTVDNGTPNEGDTVVFTITLSNNGPNIAGGVEITDLLPAGLTYVSDAPSQGSYVAGTGVWTVGTVNPVGTATLQITATVDAGTQGTIITNTATVTDSDQGDPDPGDNSDSAQVDVKSADLSLTKTTSQFAPGEGDTFTFTITVTNTGPDSSDSVVVRDIIPAGLTYVSDTPSQGSYVSGTGMWTVGTIANGGSATLDIDVSVNAGTAGQVITNVAEVWSSETADPDSTPGNTSGTEDDEDSEAITVMDADLSVMKIVDDATPRVGDTVTYTVTITNNGPDAATGIELTDLLPADLTYISNTPSQGSYISGTGVWTVGGLANSASATLQISASVNAGQGGNTINNSATITASDQGDSVPANNSDDVNITVEHADIAVAKSVDDATPREGDTIVYTVTATNSGPSAASIELTDLLPSGVTYVSDVPSQGSYVPGTGVWTVGSVANGGNATLQITATVDAGTAGATIVNTATVTNSDQEDQNAGNDTDSVNITVESADLEIVKTVDDATPNEGDTVTFTLTLTNNGPDDTTTVEITDLLPAGLTYISDTPSQGSYVSGTGVWTVGGLNAANQATLQITATVDVGTQGSILTNTATVTDSDQGDPDPGDNSDSAIVDVQSADLSLAKIVSDASPSEGENVTFTVTVSNAGPDAATGVVVEDLLPLGLTYVSSTPSQGAYVSGTGLWTVGTVGAGGNASINITASVNAGTAGQTIVNEAEVSAAETADPDSTPGNSSGTEDDEASIALTVEDADLSVVKMVDDATPDVGQTITYTVTVTNNGPNDTTGVEITDLLPAGLSYVSNVPSQGSYVPGTGVWTVGAIANGGNATLQISATVDAGQGGSTINNSASVTANDQGDSNPGNDSDDVNVTVTLIDLSLAKMVDDATPREGDTVVYTVTVSNAGPDTAENVEVTDLLPSGVTYVSDVASQGSYVSGTGVWSVGAIGNGGNATLAITATVNVGTAGSTVTNDAEVTAADQEDSDSMPGNAPSGEDDEASAAFLVESADLAVVKTVDDGNPNEGDTVTFTVTVENNGPNDTTGVELTDLLPSSLTFVSSVPSQGSYAPGTGVWTVGGLNVASQATIDITATVNAGTQNTLIVNTATVTASDQGDPDLGDNSDTATLSVQSADLELAKIVDIASPAEGATITFTLTLLNNGPHAATGVSVIDQLPAGLTYVSSTPSQGSYVAGTGIWTVGTIATSGNATLQISATVNAGTAGQTIVNNAEVLTSDVADPDSTPGNTSGTEDDEASASVLVADADLAVAKIVDDATPDVGQTITYAVTVTNNGPDAATGVELTDVVPAGLTYVSDTPSQGSYVSGTGVWSVGAIANGGNATLQISATVNAGQGGNTINNSATITASDQGDTVPGNNSDDVDVTVTLVDVAVAKSVDDATPREGDTVVYTVTVSNTGPDTAENVAVTDLLPIGITYVSDGASQGSYVSGTGVWTVGTITNGGNATLQITATVDAGTASSTIQNTATVTGVDQEDQNAGNDTDSVNITVESADLEIVKTVDDATPNEGDTVTFTLTLTNNGPNDTSVVEITDLLPAGLTYVSDTPSQGSYVAGTGVWTVGGLNAANQATLQITATVDVGTQGSILTNTATVTDSDQGDPDPGDNSDSAIVDVQSADLSLAKSFNVPGAGEGATVVMTITLTNSGPDATQNVVVADQVPAGLTYVSDAPSQGSYVPGTGVWTVGTVGAGGNAALQITATIDAGTAGQTIVNNAEVMASDVADPDSTPGNASGVEDDEATASLTVSDADLAVAKTVDDATPRVGDTVTFTVSVANNGPDATTGVIVNDLLPAGLTYVSNVPSQGSYTPGTGVWSVGAIANGGNATLQISATVDAGQGGNTINNSATVASDQGDSVPGNNADDVDVFVEEADLSLAKVVTDSTPSEGDTITYTITVTNSGPHNAGSVEVVDLLPSGLTYISDTPSQGSYTPGTGVWTVGTVANGGSATLQISATVDAGTASLTISNAAEVTASDQEDPDSTPGNAPSGEDDEASAPISVRNADLAVTKTVDDAFPNEGEAIVYTVTIANNGPNDAMGVELTDALPVGVTYISDTPSQGSYVAGTGVWTVGAILNGNSATLQISATVDAGTQGTIITNTATLTASDEGDAVAGNNQDSADIDVRSADLSLTKFVNNATPNEGGTVIFSITVSNSGPDDAEGVEITDLLPAGLTFVSSGTTQGAYVPGTGVWTVGTVAASATEQLDIEATVNVGTAGTSITNDAQISASATADPDSTPGNAPSGEDDEASQTITVTNADLAVTKIVDDATPDEGGTIVYTVTVTNNGPDNATGVEITDLLPAGVTYVNATPSQGSYVSGTGVWTVGALLNGGSANMNITATVDAGTGGTLITNTATVANVDQGDTNTGNNTDSADINVTLVDLSLTKDVNDTTPREGETIVYTITVANAGPNAAENVEVTDLLPAGITYVSDVSSQGVYVAGTGVWTVGTIAGAANATLQITATVNAGVGGSTISNVATTTNVDQADASSGNDSDNADIVVESADLELVKTVNDATPNEGETVTFTLTLTNNGPDDAGSITVTDLLPAGVTYVSDTPSQGSYVAGTGVWSVGLVNAANQATLQITATVDAGTQGTIITNTATITNSDQGDPDPGDNTDSAAVDVQSADLSLAKTVTDASPGEGETITFTLTLSNSGPDTADGVVITDLLPASLTYVSDTPSQGSYVSGTGAWTVGTVANGGNATLDITASVNNGTAGQTITNEAEISASETADPDSTPGNTSGTEDDEDAVSILVSNAGLSVTKIVDDANPNVGDTITFTVSVVNAGPDATTGVELTDALPAGLTYVSDTPSQGSYVPGTGVWTVGALANGGSATLQISATVDAGEGGNTINNSVTITASDQGDSNLADNTDDVDVVVKLIDLSLAKMVDDATPREGDTIVYTVTVSNAGPDAAEDVSVTDLLPLGVTHVSDTPSQGSYVSGTGVWTVGTVANSGSATLAITATVNAGTAGSTIVNSAEVSAAGSEDVDSTPGNAPSGEDDEASASLTVESADLELVKTVDDATPNEGDTVVYTLTVTNNGPSDTTGVEVTDLLPAGVAYVSDTPSQGSYVSGTGVWTVGALAVSNQATLQITATVDAGTQGTIITNTATITNSDQGDPDPGDNTDSTDIDVQSADLSLTKIIDVPSPSEGQNITFTIVLSNAGPDAATGVVVTDLLPAGITYISDTPSQGTYTPGTGVWTVGTIGASGGATLQISASVNNGTAGQTFVNSAEVTASDVADPDSTPGNTSGTEDDEASVSFTILNADIAVTKSVDDAAPDVGQTIVYTVVATNNGPDDATGVELTDALPPGVTYVNATPSQGSYVSGTGVWAVGSLANGASANMNITATVDAGTGGMTIVNTATVTGSDQGDTVPGNNSDDASITVTLVDLAVAKSVDDATPREGDTIVYTVVVSNGGPSDATGVELTDILPAGVTYVSDAPSQGSYVPGTGVWTVGGIVNGGSATLNITATVDVGTAAATIVNTASVSGTDQEDQNAANDSDDASMLVESADLELVKTVDDATPNEGETVTFTLTLTNNGPDDAGSIVVTDLLPAGVTYVSDTPSQGSYVSGTGVWTVGALAVSNQATLQITATVNAGTQGTIITNTATITNSDQGDPDPGDNTDSTDIDVQSADLSLTKVFDVAGASEGATVVVTLTLSNSGPDAATGVAVTDLLPAGLTYVSDAPSQGSYVAGTGVWTVGTVANGGSATLDITATVNAGTAGNTIVNNAEVTASDVADPDSTPGNTSGVEDDEASASILVSEADLGVTKSVDDATPDEGQTITYTITVTNNGPDGATGIEITDLLPAGVTYVSNTPSQGSYVSGTGVWTVGTLANAASASLDLVATVDAGTSGLTITNTATITDSDQGDTNPTNNSDDADITVTLIDLSLAKIVDDATPREGDTIVYTLTVSNAGPDTATGVEVTDLLPTGVTYVSDAPSQGSYVSGTGVWTVGPINNGASATLTITATVDVGTAAATIQNKAEVTAADQGDVDSTPGNDSGSEDDEAAALITVEFADLAVVKSVDDASPEEGDTIVYTVTVTNNGINDTSVVEVTDLLPAGVTYVSDVPSQGSYVSGTGVWTVGGIAVAAQATLQITATVDAGVAGSTITNTATVTGSDQADPDLGDNSDSADIDVVGIVDLAVTKTVNDANPKVGDTVTYTVTLTNNGPSNATNVSMLDAVPAGLTYSSHTASQGFFNSGSGVWTVGALANGQTVTIDIDATVNAGQAAQTIGNTASVAGVNENESNTANDQDDASILVQSVDIAVVKNVDDASPSEGGTIVYTVVLTNNGPNDTTGVEVTDVLPSGVTYVNATPSQGTYTPGTGVWAVGAMANGASVNMTITATVDAGTGGDVIVNITELTATDITDVNPGNNLDAATVTPGSPVVVGGGGPAPIIPSGDIQMAGVCSASNTVTVLISGENIAFYKLSEDPFFTSAPWIAYPSNPLTVQKVLSPGSGTKSLYAIFRSNTGNISGVVNDSIVIDLENGCTFPPPPQPEPDGPEVIEPPGVGGGCTLDCDRLYFNVYIINPDGTERHMNTEFAKFDNFGDGTGLIYFEDKGDDFDYNDVIVRVDRRNCANIRFDLEDGDARWDHQVRVQLMYRGTANVEDVELWPSSQRGGGTAAFVDATQFVDLCEERALAPACTVACDKFSYDIFIVNPDGTERHMNSEYAIREQLAPGVEQIMFEDKGEDFDYNDVFVTVDARSCEDVQVTLGLGAEATWRHQVHARLSYEGSQVTQDLLLWRDSQTSAGSTTHFNANDYKQLCEEVAIVPFEPCDLLCSKVTYDLYIENPDGSERHMFSRYAKIEPLHNNAVLVRFEDGGYDDFDYDDVLIEVYRHECQNIRFRVVETNATWSHKVKLKLRYNGITHDELVLWPDSQNAKDFRMINIYNFPNLCLDPTVGQFIGSTVERVGRGGVIGRIIERVFR